MFRLLKANEIECKIATVKEKGLTLLLYKTARTDMDLLDEVVGNMNWECEYREIKNNLYCGITIEKDGAKATKWDCGVESAFGDKEKGEASDAFKRAGFKWGIGRELYTSPFIWINNKNCNIENKKCYDKFEVVKIGYDENNEINELQIKNINLSRIVFDMKSAKEVDKLVNETTIKTLNNAITANKISDEDLIKVLRKYDYNTTAEIETSNYNNICEDLAKLKKGKG